MKKRCAGWALLALCLALCALLTGCTAEDDAAAREIMLALGIDPDAEESPAPAPTPEGEVALSGRVEVKKGGAALRETPGKNGVLVVKAKKGDVLALRCSTEAEGETWYGVLYEGKPVYVRADRVRPVQEKERRLKRDVPILRADRKAA